MGIAKNRGSFEDCTNESIANQAAKDFFKAIEEIEKKRLPTTTRYKPIVAAISWMMLSSGEFLIE
jgi:hypothetical protein